MDRLYKQIFWAIGSLHVAVLSLPFFSFFSPLFSLNRWIMLDPTVLKICLNSLSHTYIYIWTTQCSEVYVRNQPLFPERPLPTNEFANHKPQWRLTRPLLVEIQVYFHLWCTNFIYKYAWTRHISTHGKSFIYVCIDMLRIQVLAHIWK